MPRGMDGGRKTMDFDVGNLLGNLFGETAGVPDSPPVPEAADASADPLAALPFADWVLRPDAGGCMGWESPDLSDDERWWAVPDATRSLGSPCPKCGSLMKWWDILGGEHCQKCDRATLERAVRLADRAARLRRPEMQNHGDANRTPSQETSLSRNPAPRIDPGCVSAGMTDYVGPRTDAAPTRPARGLCEDVKVGKRN
jgi:hypothetical protein